MEVAHRLSLLPGKCENIHGHSMWVELEMWGPLDGNGILAGLDFGKVKKAFRQYIDTNFDHHCLLNKDDVLVALLGGLEGPYGVAPCNDDPTTEFLAAWIGQWACKEFVNNSTRIPIKQVKVTVHETSVNCATWGVML